MWKESKLNRIAKWISIYAEKANAEAEQGLHRCNVLGEPRINIKAQPQVIFRKNNRKLSVQL